MASSLRLYSLPQQNNLPLPFRKTQTKIPAPATLLQLCCKFQEVRQLHAHIVVSGLFPLNAKRLLESYVSMSQIDYAWSVFYTITYTDIFVYNTMIRGLTMGKCPYDAVLLYSDVLVDGLIPDNYTYTFVLKACAHLTVVFEGKQVHCQIIKAGIAPDTHVHSSLIHMYANSGSMEDAERVLEQFSEENMLCKNSMISGYLSQGHVEKARAMFDTMAAKDVASWSAMVTGYTKNGMHAEALTVFNDMMASNIVPNESTLVSLLSACAQLGALDQGKWIHAFINRIGAKISTTLGTALVDMYVKCGSIECGYEAFRKMPYKDIVTWGVAISGLAIHGQARKCFQLFDEMVGDGIRPNEVIFVAILSACSHAGFVQEGKQYFNQMVNDFGIRPTTEHYGCLVDLLGRAGRMTEAEELIRSMPEPPNSGIWGALLNACRIHNDMTRGSWAFRHLTELEPMSGHRYRQAELMFARAGDKDQADKVRKLMKEKEMETRCGSSSIEVDGMVHEFMVGDASHDKARQIYKMWEEINRTVEMTLIQDM